MGDIFIDGGAHFGSYSVLSSALIGEYGRIISFEPTPSTCEVLEKNKRQNQNIYNKGLSNINGELSFEINSVLGSEGNKVNLNSDTKIKVLRLDDILSELHIIPSVIKLYVDGHEFEVIDGMQKIFATYKPLIIMEIWHPNHNDNSNQINAIKLLESYNYKLYELKNDGEISFQNLENIFKINSSDSFNVILKSEA